MKWKNKNINNAKYIWTLLFLVFLVLPFSAQAGEISADNVIKLVNKERISQGLGTLMENSTLNAAARDKAQDMIKNDYFAHTSPSGTSPWYWFEKSGYDYKYAGENLAINFSSAEEQHKAWMKSATHRKNILNPAYREIGVAVAKGKIDGSSTTLVVQLFGTPAVIASKPASETPIKETAAEKIQGEQAAGEIIPQNQNQEAVALPEIKEEPKIKIEPLTPDSQKLGRLVCESGACYFSSRGEGVIEKKMTESAAWLAAVMILVMAICINSITLSYRHRHNPFIAGNTVVLLLVLTSMVLWRI